MIITGNPKQGLAQAMFKLELISIGQLLGLIAMISPMVGSLDQAESVRMENSGCITRSKVISKQKGTNP